MYKLKIVELPKPLNIKTQVNFPEVVLGKMQEKTVKPKTTFQEILPDKNYDGLSKVNVEAVTNEIDTNIKSENIKKDVSILGVQGNIEELKGTKLEITKNGTYTPAEPYNAFTEVEANMEPDLSEYFTDTIGAGNSSVGGFIYTIKKLPTYTNVASDLTQAFIYYQGTTLPNINTSNVTNMNSMCNNDGKLEIIPLLDCSKVIALFYCFSGNSMLKTLGGFQNLGQAYSNTVSANNSTYTLNLSASSKLTHDSLMNVGNNLYDIASKGCNIQQVIIGSTNIGKLTPEELLVFTNKGWSVS